MTAPSHESDPQQLALFDVPTQEQREDAWQAIGSREAARPLTHDERMALGRQGLGGARQARYFEDHTFYEERGIGMTSSEEDRERARVHTRALAQVSLDQHWRRSIRAQESGDSYGAAREKARVDAINKRQLSRGHEPLGPSFDALPESQQDQ
jgi:hypothetical protein